MDITALFKPAARIELVRLSLPMMDTTTPMGIVFGYPVELLRQYKDVGICYMWGEILHEGMIPGRWRWISPSRNEKPKAVA